jgi:excisionase family DNA binding protein
MTEKDTYRPDELAEALCVSIWTIYRMLARDEIKHVHIGQLTRIPREEFARLVKADAPKLPTTA